MAAADHFVPTAQSSSTIDYISSNTVRTLPPIAFGSSKATPKIDYKDELWTEIDVLDDVKRMAEEQTLYKGFPEDFEDHLGKLRHIHATLLNTIEDSFIDDFKTQQDKIMTTMAKIAELSHF